MKGLSASVTSTRNLTRYSGMAPTSSRMKMKQDRSSTSHSDSIRVHPHSTVSVSIGNQCLRRETCSIQTYQRAKSRDSYCRVSSRQINGSNPPTLGFPRQQTKSQYCSTKKRLCGKALQKSQSHAHNRCRRDYSIKLIHLAREVSHKVESESQD